MNGIALEATITDAYIDVKAPKKYSKYPYRIRAKYLNPQDDKEYTSYSETNEDTIIKLNPKIKDNELIDEYTFYYSGLKKVTFDNVVKSIQSHAFYACKLENLYLPDSIEYIGYNYIQRTGSTMNSTSYEKTKKKAQDLFEHYKFLIS